MADLRKRVAYLQGMMAGMDLGDQSREARVLSEMVGVLEDMADSLMQLSDTHSTLESYVESIDQDLQELEEEIYQGQMKEEEMVEVECPTCHDMVCFSSDILEDDDVIEVTCPECDSVVFINDQDYEFVEDNDTLISHTEEDI